MAALFAGPGSFWPWLAILVLGCLAARPLTRVTHLPAVWLLVLAVPLGVTFYAFLLVPAFALFPPRWAPPAVAVLALAGAGIRMLRLRQDGTESRVRGPRPFRREIVPDLLAALALLACAAVVSTAGARLALAVLMQAPVPPILGEPSPLDSGLHALRTAMIARHGIPAPSPLDPDYPLQYRYMVNALAASFATAGAAGYAASSAAAGGLCVGALLLAAGALVRITTGSAAAALAGGLLGALYGPTYWLPEVIALLRQGSPPTLPALGALMGERWALSPLTPAFPSVFSSLGSSLWLPFAVLSWTVLLLIGAAARHADRTSRRWWLALVGLGAALLTFSAEYFVPLAVLSASVAAVLIGLTDRTRPRRSSLRPVWTHVGAAGVGLAAGFLPILLSTGHLTPTGGARGVRLVPHLGFASTPSYGGNHALLGGGTALPLPNWVHLHDWGLLFWPASLTLLGLSLHRRNAVLAVAAAAAVLTAIFWHAVTLVYETGAATDFRVQMYRYASMATAISGPLSACVVALLLRGRRPAALKGILLLAVTAVGAGAGLYLTFGALFLSAEPPPQYRHDAAAAARLAQESPGGRLALLNGPASFLEFYSEQRGPSVAIWLGAGGTSVPVGWDFGHPERYEPLYRRVVRDFDPAAAGALRLTHVAYAPAGLSAAQRENVRIFLARCAGTVVGTFGDQSAPEGRALWRIEPDSCGSGSAP